MLLGSWFRRAVGAAVLDASTYEDVETDRHATWQAGLTVVLSSLAAGIGAGGWHGAGWRPIAFTTTIALITWVAWASLTFQIGARWLAGPETRTSYGELLRTVGFASAPGVIQVAAMLPHLAGPAFAVAWIWMFAAMVIAVQHALDYPSIGRAIAVCGVAAAIALAMAFAFSNFFARNVTASL